MTEGYLNIEGNVSGTSPDDVKNISRGSGEENNDKCVKYQRGGISP